MSKKETIKRNNKNWLKNNKDLRKNEVYGGCKVYSPSGNLMFICVDKKANWYLNKKDDDTGEPLARKIKHINPVINFLMTIFFIKTKYTKIQFTFEPKNEGNNGDPYSLAGKENKCVVSGDENLELLTKHHITPYCYRKFMPDEYKSANSHDIVPITRDKHYEYERHADNLKKEISKKFDAPLGGLNKVNHKLFYAIKSANAIKKNSAGMPEDRIKFHKEVIRKYSGQKRVSQKMIDKLYNSKYEEARKLKSHGEIVVEKLMLGGDEALQNFVEMWRSHFIENANPKYMPKYWDIKRPAARIEIEKPSDL